MREIRKKSKKCPLIEGGSCKENCNSNKFSGHNYRVCKNYREIIGYDIERREGEVKYNKSYSGIVKSSLYNLY